MRTQLSPRYHCLLLLLIPIIIEIALGTFPVRSSSLWRQHDCLVFFTFIAPYREALTDVIITTLMLLVMHWNQTKATATRTTDFSLTSRVFLVYKRSRGVSFFLLSLRRYFKICMPIQRLIWPRKRLWGRRRLVFIKRVDGRRTIRPPYNFFRHSTSLKVKPTVDSLRTLPYQNKINEILPPFSVLLVRDRKSKNRIQ